MKDLWNRTFELFRRRLILWVPCSIAGILMLALARLEKDEIRSLIGLFATQHSVLGGDVPSAQGLHRAVMIIYSLGFLKLFLEVCLFVGAFATTSNLVQMIVEESRPEMLAGVRRIAPRSREVLLFSFKYMAVMALIAGALIVLSTSPLTPEYFHELAASKVFIFAFSLVGEACLAWILIPSAIRLLRPPGNPTITPQHRKMGVFFAVATSALSLALQFIVGRAESTVILDKPWEGWGIAVVNTVIINAPQVLLFIALALLATLSTSEETSPATEPEMP